MRQRPYSQELPHPTPIVTEQASSVSGRLPASRPGGAGPHRLGSICRLPPPISVCRTRGHISTNVVDDGLAGDVDPAVGEVAAWLTPVPGGTRPVTTAILLRATVQAACDRLGVTLTTLPSNGSVSP